MRKLGIFIILAVFFAGFGFSASRMEHLRANGIDALLPLAPVDPRALLMGDYMDLDYTGNRDIRSAFREAHSASQETGRSGGVPLSGLAVMRLEPLPDRGGREHPESPYPVASFVRLDDGSPLARDEVLLAFKVRERSVVTAAPSFYFQEGHADAYERARFGRVKMGKDGKTLLVGLCDEAGLDIVPQKTP